MDKRILIVDDNALIRQLLRTIINSRPGFEVCGEAADGIEGVEKSRELKPDLIVLDLLMPRMNGLDAAMALQDILPDAPIILFTFHKEALPIDQIRKAGVTSVLSKTEQLDVLFDEVKRLTAA